MNLIERLASAERDRAQVITSTTPDEETNGRHHRARGVDPTSDLKQTVHQALLANLGPKLYDSDLPAAELEQMVRVALQQEVALTNPPLSAIDRTRITQEIADDILGYGPIEPFLRDPDLTEVMVNGHDDIWIERAGRLQRVEGRFSDEQHLRRTIDKIVSRIGRRVDESSPM